MVANYGNGIALKTSKGHACVLSTSYKSQVHIPWLWEGPSETPSSKAPLRRKPFNVVSSGLGWQMVIAGRWNEHTFHKLSPNWPSQRNILCPAAHPYHCLSSFASQWDSRSNEIHGKSVEFVLGRWHSPLGRAKGHGLSAARHHLRHLSWLRAEVLLPLVECLFPLSKSLARNYSKLLFAKKNVIAFSQTDSKTRKLRPLALGTGGAWEVGDSFRLLQFNLLHKGISAHHCSCVFCVCTWF